VLRTHRHLAKVELLENFANRSLVEFYIEELLDHRL